MRRLLALTPAALLLTAALGCHHTGICDCGPDQSANSCCAPHAAGHVIKSEPIKAAPSKAEPIKALPKLEGK